jgi:hypothetical protein
MMMKTQTITKTYVVARQAMKFSDHLRLPGKLVPEAADWAIQARDAWLNQGWLEEIAVLTDADRRAVAQQWEREEAARAEAAAKAPKLEPKPRPRPVQPEPAETLRCANCRTLSAFMEPVAPSAWWQCGGCGQRQTAEQSRRGSLEKLAGHTIGHNHVQSYWRGGDAL